jgi:hypothetical protein
VRSVHARQRPGLQVWDTGAARASRRGPRRGTLQWRASSELFASITMLASVTGLSAAPRACQAAFAPGGAAILGGHYCPARSRACSCVGADRCATQRRGRSRALGDDGAVRLPLAGNMRMLRRAALSASSGRRSDEATRAELERRRLQGGLPQHLAIVMDGNRRYAKSLGFPTASVPAPPRPAHPHPVAQLAFIRAVLPVSMAASLTSVSLRRFAPGSYGHLKGKERLEQTIRWVLVDLRIPFLTVYALSQENFAKRTPEVLPSLVQSPTAPCARLRVGARPGPCSRTWR